MATVPTVRGEVDGAELGPTLMHEHVVNITAEVARDYPDLSWTRDKEGVLRSVVAQLRDVKSRGIGAVVDCTAFGHGRDVDALQRINEQVDLHIIACTGIYTYDYLPFFFVYGHPVRTVDGKDVDILTEMFVRDVTEGIARSGVKAGMIKTATDHAGVTPNIERVLRAVARAHRATGAPITTHTVVSERNGLDQQRIFAEEGVDLSRVVIGHSGDSTDLGYLRRLLDAGSTIGADRFGLYLPDIGMPGMETRIRTLAQLCAEGYSDRIVLSHDVTCYGDWLPRDLGGGSLVDWVQTHISDKVVPALLEAGVTGEQVDQMLVANPRRILERRGPY
jgi:phosphotriesterase-related protein